MAVMHFSRMDTPRQRGQGRFQGPENRSQLGLQAGVVETHSRRQMGLGQMVNDLDHGFRPAGIGGAKHARQRSGP